MRPASYQLLYSATVVPNDGSGPHRLFLADSSAFSRCGYVLVDGREFSGCISEGGRACLLMSADRGVRCRSACGRCAAALAATMTCMPSGAGVVRATESCTMSTTRADTWEVGTIESIDASVVSFSTGADNSVGLRSVSCGGEAATGAAAAHASTTRAMTDDRRTVRMRLPKEKGRATSSARPHAIAFSFCVPKRMLQTVQHCVSSLPVFRFVG